MYFLHKRHLVWLLLLIYSLSYFLQSWFFVDLWNVLAENPTNRTNLVAIFVDKDVYQNSKSYIEWYATDYIQQRISNSKALILPINTKNFKAIDLVRMLENMYFDWIKWETSNLLWAVFVWDIPLPVVQNDWFIYPTIFPYVDFEEQQFVYDANQQFFVYNKNPRWQAEIWHWIINFWSEGSKYNDFFKKLRTYNSNPSEFVAPLMRYDDFYAMKTTFSQDSLPFYVNNFLFTEDVWYHRFTNLMLDYFKSVQNDSMAELADWLSKASQNNPQLAQIMSEWAWSFDALWESSVPTTMLLSVIKELITRYENLYPGVFLSTIKDNTQAASRWYKQTLSGDLVDGIDSHIHKIALKDSLTIWDVGKWISPVIISFNDAMEQALDKKIEDNRWYMSIPVILEYNNKDRETKKKKILGIPKRWCEKTVDDVYKNYYFGTYAADITSAQQFNAYRWTFRNLDSFSGVNILNSWYNSYWGKSLGASNNVFATQVEANRWYNIMSAASDYDTYSENKIKTSRDIVCSRYFKILWIKIFCMTRTSEYVWEEYESIEDFAIRWRWWASSLNLDSDMLAGNPPQYVLKQYDYTSAMFPIYDIWWSVAVVSWKNTANSFLGSDSFASLIKVGDRYWRLDYPKYIKWETDSYPLDVYYSEVNWYRELIGTKKIRESYDNFDYFSIWSKTTDRWSQKRKIIDVNWIKEQRKSSDTIWWKCSSSREIFSYKYKTIDSRVKNTSPTTDQVNWTYKNEFSEDWIFWKHYDYLKQNLSLLKDNSKLSFDDSYSGLVYLLSGHKDVNKNINTFAAISSSDPNVLLSWVKSIFDQTWQNQYIEVFSGVFIWLENASDLLPELNFWLVLSYFDRISEVESLYNQKTKFLSWRTNDLNNIISSIKTQYDVLPVSLNQITWVYQNIKIQKFATGTLISKKDSINKLQNCGTSLAPNYCWCENNYKQVCQNIDSIVLSLNLLSQKLSTIEYTTIVEQIDWESVVIEVKLLETIKTSLEESSSQDWFLSDIPLVQQKITSIEKVNVMPPLSYQAWLNQTTADRPIDWPRKITFQWLWWELVSFVYPNIYDVSIYKQEDSVLILKNINEINQSIVEYLISKTKEYNKLLSTQISNSNKYYIRNKTAFDFLAESDSLASPNTRSNNELKLLPEDFFVSLIWEQRIADLAELLYYQTLPVYAKQNETTIDKDLESTRTAFDLNKKIAYVISGYITQHPDQGSLVTPAYNSSGYEVAYINSDRSDYISASVTPAFIEQLKNSQTSLSNVLEDSILNSNELFSATRTVCWIDSSYTELIFDLSEEKGKGKMPWISAVQCWWSTLGSSVKFDVSMEVGPSFGEFLSWLKSTFDDWTNSLKQTFSKDKPWAEFSGDLSEYWANVILANWEDIWWPQIKSASLNVPTTKLLAWSQLPIRISAQDFSGKNISRAMNSYFVYVNTWNWEFINAWLSWNQSIEFFDFDNTTLLYKSPLVDKATDITFLLTGEGVDAQKTIVVTPWNLQISYWSKKIYTNNKVQSPISFTLTWVDSTYSSLPRIVLSLKAQDGSVLQTPFSVISKNGLVKPWVISSGSFVWLNSYFLEKTEQAVFLMPNYRAWEDELWIQIPWLEPIVIPVVVNPGQAYKISLGNSKSNYNVWETFTWNIFVSDARWNDLSGTVAVKIGSLWNLDFSTRTVQINSSWYSFSVKTKEPWWISYIYAFLDSIPLTQQYPAYQKIIVQQNFLPEKNLNVMYLNLFGSDWWNAWTQDALNPSYISNLISDSQKLLAVTTQIVEPTSLKKFAAIISEDWQIRNIAQNKTFIRPYESSLIADFVDIWRFPLVDKNNVVLFTSDDPINALNSFSDKKAALIFSKISSLQDSDFVVTDYSLSFSWVTLFDLKKEIWDELMYIELSEKFEQWYSSWDVYYQQIKIWSLYFVLPENKPLDVSDFVLYSKSNYDKEITFAEWTTNWNKWIWIIDLLWSFEKQWYNSLEDSLDYENWIWFRWDFKNITLFGDWKTVWESTVPFGSQFLINFWDPLLSRISDNIQIESVSHDLWIWEHLYNNTSKSILKVLDTDFNNDSLVDVVVVLSDGSIKLLKNYWWSHPYTNMQDLIRISDSIKDAFVWDVDGNNYPDILIWTNNNQLRVYKNDKWVFDVDWNLICLNINADGTKIQSNPESVQWLQQLFFEDMDKDWKIDIITNDNIWDIKIFYWWSKSGQWNYVSTLKYACDDNWYGRQKDSIKLVKSYGVVVDEDFYIQDQSLIHIRWWNISQQTPISEDQVNDLAFDESAFENLDVSNIDIWWIVSDMSNSFQDMSSDFIENQLSVAPISYVPIYDSWIPPDEIWYKNLLQLSGDSSISVYKKYDDINWWSLISWDIVKITTTILWLKNDVKATYMDNLVWPWEIPVDDKNRILSFKKESPNFNDDNIIWQQSDDILFVIDNINLDNRQSLKFSYEVVYLWESTTSIDVKDVAFKDVNKEKDEYMDVVVNPKDSCKKYGWIFFNTSSQNHRNYEEVFDNIQAKLDAYTAQWQSEWEEILDSSMPDMSSFDSSTTSAEDYLKWTQDLLNDALDSINWDLFESWSVSDLFSNSQTNINFDMTALDSMMAPVSEEIDKILDGMCQWFKLWAKSWCQPPVPFNMIPFNQAFLAPWDYHIFGCFQQLMKPISDTLWKWWPLLSVPGNRWPTPVWYIPAPNIFGFPFRWPTDWFLWWPKSWTYPSQLRLYLVPTLTLQMWVAICFGPYTLWANIPPLFRDLWWNCVVTAFPMYACNWWDSWEDGLSSEELESWMTDMASNGTCEQPIQNSSAKVLSNSIIIQQPTYVSPFRLSSLGSQNSSWTMAVPNGNFWWFGYVSFSSKPIKKTTDVNTYRWNGWGFNFEAFSFIKWPKIDLKIKDSSAQWIIKVLVKDWLGRQVKYMVNNLTKLTINVTLPDVSQLTDGFDSLFSAVAWDEANKAAEEDDVVKLKDVEDLASKQTYQAINSSVNNPFESLITIFQSVPLVDLYTKDVVLKIPLPTSDELLKYESYLRSWLKNQTTTLKKRLEAMQELASVCWEMTPVQAQIDLNNLNDEIENINKMSDSSDIKDKLIESANKEKIFLTNVIDWKIITKTSTLIDDTEAVFVDIWNQFKFFSQKLVALPRLNFVRWCLVSTEAVNLGCDPRISLSEDEKQKLLNYINERTTSLSSCAVFSSSMDDFTSFYNQSINLVKNVQQNIQILEQYKEFPLQLYDWMHFVDKYMSDIMNFVSKLSSTLISWVSVNAKIYSKWIDALIAILSTIKTWQVLIDLSTNWTKKCWKCTRDWYWSHSCSLGFLFPEIPILPIPPFKIPNINIDLSHIDLGISIALPRFVFTPVSFPLPKLPDLPPPPNFNLAAGLNFAVQFDYSLPEVPLLPSPPTLPELPSFIPKIDFSLPLLPPAPKIPNIIPEVSSIIEVADFVTQVFCILKKGFGLVWEKWVKAKIEQMTQRTWDVPIFDFFDQTSTWQTDPKPQWFDLQLDGFLQFKMDFSAFYWFLNQISQTVNSFSSNVVSAYSKWIDELNSWLNNNKVMDFLNNDIQDIDFNFTIPPLDIPIKTISKNSDLDYDVAYKKLMAWLNEIESSVEDPDIQKDVSKITSVLETKTIVNPAIQKIQTIEKEIQTILFDKQKEVRDLANSINSYDQFVAQIKNNDIALVNDDYIETSFSTPLFTTNQETYDIIKQQEAPLKAYMDTNASLVGRYLETLNTSSPDELRMTKSDYKNTTEYLENVKSGIDNVYDKLWFEKISYNSCWLPYISQDTITQDDSQILIAQNSSDNPSQSSTTSSSASDISSYVRGVFVENPESWTMINVVKSDYYISKIGDKYFETDLNKDNKNDLIMRDSNNVYVKYADQKFEHQNISTNKSLHVYSPWIFSASYMDSYKQLVEKADKDWYVDFGDISVKLVSNVQEVKNFKMIWQSFDAIQMSWTNHNTLWEESDWYLIKLNHRIDTYNDKDQNFSFLDDKFLNKRYILVVPSDINYSGATIDFNERYYYKWKDYDKARSVLDFLSGWIYSELILAVKFYKPDQPTISFWLKEIPRNRQYAEIVSLKNTNTLEEPKFVTQWPWSNQIVAWRQLLADMVWPEAVITLERPSISEIISTWSSHNWFVWTYYNLVANWKDNVAVSRMRIQQWDNLISFATWMIETGAVEITGLYFSWENSLEYLFGAEDFAWNTQFEKVTLDIKIPDIQIKEFVPLSESSGQLIAELSDDIDEWMVVFQRQRNDLWQEMSWTLSNSYWWFFVGPKQKIVTGSVFSLGNTLWLFDGRGNEIWQISVDWNVTILPKYQDIYTVMLDLITWYPLVRVLNKQTETTVFWIQMPAYSLSSINLYQKEPFYTKIDLTQQSFDAFLWWSCIQSIDKECILYISPKWQIYIPKISSASLVWEYRYDTVTRSVIYVIKDFLEKDIVRITIKTSLFK